MDKLLSMPELLIYSHIVPCPSCAFPFRKDLIVRFIYTHKSLYQVHLFNYLFTQIANQPITRQQLSAFRHEHMVKVGLSIRVGMKGDLRAPTHGTILDFTHQRSAL